MLFEAMQLNTDDAHTSLHDFYGNIYSQLGQIIESWDHSDSPTQFTYDPLGRCIATKHPKCPVRESPPKHPITKKAYDAAGNITQSRDADGNITQTTYNVFGQPLIITYPDHSTESYRYDKLGRVTTHTNKAGTPTYYTYDVLGFACTKHTDAEGYTHSHTTTCTWDAHGNLISEALANNLKLSSQYDLANNKIELTYPDQSRAIHYTAPH